MLQMKLLLLFLCVIGQRWILVSSLDKIRAVNLGGWLVIEGWMKPALFDNIPENKDMLDGTGIQLQSVKSGKYVSAEGGGGGNLSVNRGVPNSWETFKLWRVSHDKYQLRVLNLLFIQVENEGGGVNARSSTASTWETFQFISSPNDPSRVHIRANSGKNYLQANGDQLTADYDGEPDWDDSNPAVFKMTILMNTKITGEWQLSNAYDDREEAARVLQEHRSSFITEADFQNMPSKKINAVRIPVGWWIKYEENGQNPPAPFVRGSLQALDNAFDWAEKHGIKIIVDLHAAPGAQGVEAHSGSRDGTSKWNASASLEVIDFLARRYKDRQGLLGLELLNEPNPQEVTLEDLKKYYSDGYNLIRTHSQDVQVVLCQFVPGESTSVSNLMPSGAKNVVLDVHLYTVFSKDLSTKEANINEVNTSFRQTISSLNAVEGASVLVGEWVNEWTIKDGSYYEFGDAQLEVFGKASFGWAYWALKNVDSTQWSFEKCVLRVPQGNGDWPN